MGALGRRSRMAIESLPRTNFEQTISIFARFLEHMPARGVCQGNVMTRKSVILTEIIAPYRIPVFNILARRAGLDLHVIFLAETDETLRQWRVYKNEICFSH